MTVTVWGPIVDDDGLSFPHRETWIDHRHGLVEEYRCSALPAANFRGVQPETIPVDVAHDGNAIGQVVHLEHAHRRLHAVAVLNDVDVDTLDELGPLYWSPTTLSTVDRGSLTATGVELHSVAIVQNPAGTGLTPLRYRRGDVRRDWERRAWPASSVPDVVRHAGDTCDMRRRAPGPITIHDPKAVEIADAEYRQQHRPRQLEYRTYAGSVLAVR